MDYSQAEASSFFFASFVSLEILLFLNLPLKKIIAVFGLCPFDFDRQTLGVSVIFFHMAGSCRLSFSISAKNLFCCFCTFCLWYIVICLISMKNPPKASA
ncbi:hypothetical protein OWV82_017500 [Melia azedarach]|uniref:Uncharacterized protein n=1 Tax=Melia azedarach TaxID=155640 RepID=A0ACC1XJJ6_MELAZ|nr:hypothetical protein OWV82_017500 [Melia azedarach]